MSRTTRLALLLSTAVVLSTPLLHAGGPPPWKAKQVDPGLAINHDEIHPYFATKPLTGNTNILIALKEQCVMVHVSFAKVPTKDALKGFAITDEDGMQVGTVKKFVTPAQVLKNMSVQNKAVLKVLKKPSTDPKVLYVMFHVSRKDLDGLYISGAGYRQELSLKNPPKAVPKK